VRPNAEQTVLEGVLVAVGWGDAGEVVLIGLMTRDETEHHIEPGTASDNCLHDHLRKRVRLSGVLNGGRLTRVSRVEILTSP
jgi:hypothetical protein